MEQAPRSCKRRTRRSRRARLPHCSFCAFASVHARSAGATRGDPPVCLMSKMKTKHPPLTVRFAGPDSAIGANVRLLDGAGKLLGTRTIAGGDGRMLQGSPEARFTAPNGKYRVEVRYSSGAVRAKTVDLADKPAWETIDEKTPVAAGK